MLVLFAAASSAGASAKAVEVKIYAESLCPDCRAFLGSGGAAASAFEAPGVAAAAKLTLNECGHCAPNATVLPGGFECQHGPLECAGNTLVACGVALAGADELSALPYVSCMYDAGDNIGDVSVVNTCAAKANLNGAAVLLCAYGKEGPELMSANYLLSKQAGVAGDPATRHGVPYVTVNGKALDDPEKELLGAICEAAHPKPAGCPALGVVRL